MKSGQKCVEALSDRIRVHGFDFTIEKWDAHAAVGAGRWGEFSPGEQLIRVRLDMPTPHKAVDTVLHEISHAIYWAYGVDDADEEERIVETFGSAWMQIYRDNIWLLKWIQSSLA